MPANNNLREFFRAALRKPEFDRYLPYGTAGFRDDAKFMAHACQRAAALAVVRSYVCDGAATGLMITASHNGPADNGVKLVDPDGGMLNADFEKLAQQLVNAADPVEELLGIFRRSGISEPCATDTPEKTLRESFGHCRVFLGCDTRESSPELKRIAREMIQLMRAECVDCGVVTTPILHFATAQANVVKDFPTDSPSLIQGAYRDFFEKQLSRFVDGLPQPASRDRPLLCDCANGVGGRLASMFEPLLKSAAGVRLELRNTGEDSDGTLNEMCGTEYIQKEKKVPRNFESVAARTPCCALDGDADRLIYFTLDAEGSLVLLDGDCLAALLCTAISRLIAKLGGEKAVERRLRVGVVQTAYANGASTAFFKQLQAEFPPTAELHIRCTKTGVKHLHHAAQEFDIGVYFESNGHGTVLFKRPEIEAWAKPLGGVDDLLCFLAINNQTTGDALSGILAVEAALHYLGEGFNRLADLYQGLIVRQAKVPMPREELNRIKPNSIDESTLVEPKELQDKIDAIVRETGDPLARAFVRPSGTENVLRLYAEAADEATVARIKTQIFKIFA